MRQERVQQFKELNKIKEDKKKLELSIKNDSVTRTRKIRSNFRNTSRDNSNVSSTYKAATKSPNYRLGSEYKIVEKLDDQSPERYELKKSDTVKKIEAPQTVQQPKIRGKEHSEIISTELLK